jgi:hypothetical protein
MAALQVGSNFSASGFLASHRNGRGVVLHLTDVTTIETPVELNRKV